jgi:ABC-type dipeptide/oligopeptide/nickel transport system ATPase component
LIILRGPAGSGKTSVCHAIVQILGEENSCKLDLDITYPQEDKFENNLRICLIYENVIGMMFYGNSHTGDPSKWIGKFREKGYKILSIILFASRETCIKRCIEDSNTGRHPINKERDLISKYYDDFYDRERNNPFAVVASVVEVTVNTENKSPDKIAKEILVRFNEFHHYGLQKGSELNVNY